MVSALLLLVVPGAVIAAAARLPGPLAVALGPVLTYGAVGAAIVPFGALGIRWNALSALATLVAIAGVVAGLRIFAGPARRPAISRRSTVTVFAGVLLGSALIAVAAIVGIDHWQSIPSTWDAVWHANEIRFILDTGQASPTHMGELRNVETHAPLYYPSAFHALVAVFCQLSGAAATTGATLCGLAAAVWLFGVSAALLAWRLAGSATAAAAAAALAASFTAVPYVEFGTAAWPNLVAYGLAVPAFFLITSAVQYRDRIPLAVLALLGVFSVHTTGGMITLLLALAWWLGAGLRHPVRGRVADAVALAAVAVPAGLALAPQLLSVRRQAEIIAGHSFLTHEGRKSGLRDALLLHTRHLNDFPIQYALVGLAAAGAIILAAKKVWWPLALWAVLVVAIVHSSAPLGGPAGALIHSFSALFYSDPRRLMAAVTLLLTAFAGIAVAAAIQRVTGRQTLALAGIGLLATGLAVHYLPRHEFLLGDKYDSVMIDDRDLQAFAHLAELPGARETVIGNANTDGTAWMYAVAGLHPLWTHYDYPMQQGPGEQRFIFWAFADDADTDPRVARAVAALNIRYVLISAPVVRGFTLPDGLLSLDTSRSWAKIYDNGGARIYEWRGMQQHEGDAPVEHRQRR